MKFSRGMEAEADLLGLEYMYKTGYDPEQFVDFFEKIETLEKKRPGTISKVFSTHPMTDDRIKAAQKNIQAYLKVQPEYVIDTSEFQYVKARLESLENRHKPEDKDDHRPTLKRKESGKIDQNGDQKGDDDDDQRPTLKRRD